MPSERDGAMREYREDFLRGDASRTLSLFCLSSFDDISHSLTLSVARPGVGLIITIARDGKVDVNHGENFGHPRKSFRWENRSGGTVKTCKLAAPVRSTEIRISMP